MERIGELVAERLVPLDQSAVVGGLGEQVRADGRGDEGEDDGHERLADDGPGTEFLGGGDEHAGEAERDADGGAVEPVVGVGESVEPDGADEHEEEPDEEHDGDGEVDEDLGGGGVHQTALRRPMYWAKAVVLAKPRMATMSTVSK